MNISEHIKKLLQDASITGTARDNLVSLQRDPLILYLDGHANNDDDHPGFDDMLLSNVVNDSKTNTNYNDLIKTIATALEIKATFLAEWEGVEDSLTEKSVENAPTSTNLNDYFQKIKLQRTDLDYTKTSAPASSVLSSAAGIYKSAGDAIKSDNTNYRSMPKVKTATTPKTDERSNKLKDITHEIQNKLSSWINDYRLTARYLNPLDMDTKDLTPDNATHSWKKKLTKSQASLLQKTSHSLNGIANLTAKLIDPDKSGVAFKDASTEEKMQRYAKWINDHFEEYAQLTADYLDIFDKVQPMLVALAPLPQINNENRSYDINAFIIRPAQNILKYGLLTKELFNNSSPELKERTAVNETLLNHIQTHAGLMNDAKKIFETNIKLQKQLIDLKNHLKYLQKKSPNNRGARIQIQACNEMIDLLLKRNEPYTKEHYIEKIAALEKIINVEIEKGKKLISEDEKINDIAANLKNGFNELDMRLKKYTPEIIADKFNTDEKINNDILRKFIQNNLIPLTSDQINKINDFLDPNKLKDSLLSIQNIISQLKQIDITIPDNEAKLIHRFNKQLFYHHTILNSVIADLLSDRILKASTGKTIDYINILNRPYITGISLTTNELKITLRNLGLDATEQDLEAIRAEYTAAINETPDRNARINLAKSRAEAKLGGPAKFTTPSLLLDQITNKLRDNMLTHTDIDNLITYQNNNKNALEKNPELMKRLAAIFSECAKYEAQQLIAIDIKNPRDPNDKLSYFVIKDILSKNNAGERIACLKHWMKVASACKDGESLTPAGKSIVLALNREDVSTLSLVKANLDEEQKKFMYDLQISYFMQPVAKNFSSLLPTSSPSPDALFQEIESVDLIQPLESKPAPKSDEDVRAGVKPASSAQSAKGDVPAPVPAELDAPKKKSPLPSNDTIIKRLSENDPRVPKIVDKLPETQLKSLLDKIKEDNVVVPDSLKDYLGEKRTDLDKLEEARKISAIFESINSMLGTLISDVQKLTNSVEKISGVAIQRVGIFAKSAEELRIAREVALRGKDLPHHFGSTDGKPRIVKQ